MGKAYGMVVWGFRGLRQKRIRFTLGFRVEGKRWEKCMGWFGV